MFKKILGLGLISVFLLSGCGKDATLKEKIEGWKEVTTFMQENDMAGTATLSSTGDPYVYQKLGFGLNTGVSLHASVQFNSKSPTSKPANDGLPRDLFPND